MYANVLSSILLAILIAESQAISCYTCDGVLSDLTNQTCSVISTNDSCYTTIGYAVDTGNWIISMGAFQENIVSPDDFPYDYVKPKSGSPFFEVFWTFSNQIGSQQLMLARVFCYKDYCNPLSIIQSYTNSGIDYQSFTLTTPVDQCLICNVSDYNAAERCNKIQTGCNLCSLTSNITLNDLFSWTDWSSMCSPGIKTTHTFKQDSAYGYLILQFEIDTKLMNIYTFIDCQYTICSSFDFLLKFMQSVKIII